MASEIDDQLNHLMAEMVAINDVLAFEEGQGASLLDDIFNGREDVSVIRTGDIPDLLKEHWIKYCDLLAMKEALACLTDETADETVVPSQEDIMMAWNIQREEVKAQEGFKLAQQFHDDVQLAYNMSAQGYGDLDEEGIDTAKGKKPATPVARELRVEKHGIPEDCPICMEPIDAIYHPRHARVSLAAPSSSKRRLLGLTLPCQHTFCSACFKSYMKASVENNRIPLPCPMDGCNAHITSAFLEPYYGHTPAFIKYAELEFMRNSTRDLIYCPSKTCNQPMLRANSEQCLVISGDGKSDLTDEEASIFELSMVRRECPSCATLICTRCETYWHENISCEQYQALPEDERSKEDAQLHALVKKHDWKRCPSCRAVVERKVGCNYMKCRCGSGFCYKCGALYKSNTVTANNVHGQPRCKCPLFEY